MSAPRQRAPILDPEPVRRGLPSGWMPRDFWIATGLFLAIVAMYQPIWHAQFIWDDDAHLTAHPSIVGPLGLKEVWTTSQARYFPLVLTMFWAVKQVFGLDPLVFHLTGVALHFGCALVLWLVLRRLRIPGAWLGAALWALHPVQVESVAWVSEIINSQSGLFFLLSLFFAARWLDPDSGRAGGRLDYGAALLCALAAMLSKPSTVMLPVAIALACWWRRGRLSWRDARWLAPFFALSVATSAWAIWEQSVAQGASGEAWNQSPVERIVIAGRAVWFYAAKILWPHPLSFIYPRWSIDATRLSSWLPVFAAVAALGALGFAGLRRDGAWRGVLFAAAYHVALLFPVLGFFNVYYFRYSFVADHFQYLASMGLPALAGAGIATLYRRSGENRWPAMISAAAAGAVVITFMVVGGRHVGDFTNEENLWRATLRTNPTCVLAHNNLGVLLVETGRPPEAVAHYQRALELDPNLEDAHFNLGKALVTMPGRTSDAIREFEAAVAAKPKFEPARLALANALATVSGRRSEAIAQYEAALQLNPQEPKAHSNLALLLTTLPERLTDAIGHGEAAVKLQPDLPDAHFNLANILARVPGREAGAIQHYETALRLKPDYLKAHINLGLAYARLPDRLPDAIRHYEAALAIDPRSAVTHNNLAIALAQSGRRDEARKHFERALELEPQYADARNNLAHLLAQP